MLPNVCKMSREQDNVNWQNRYYGRFLCVFFSECSSNCFVFQYNRKCVF